MLSSEINIESILALEEQIRENDSEAAVARLKRARYSLLNISKLPPEVLGKIFCWNVTNEDDFGGLGKESHNFLLVCHHWFQVASSTPEIWSFWGSTPRDWARLCRYSGTAPLDLVLDVDEREKFSFDPVLFNVLQDRANRDTVRSIHLKAVAHPELLTSVISSLIAGSGALRSSSVESLDLRNEDDEPVDASDFFSHYRFPRLQSLKLLNCTISSLDLIISRITVLTTLVLDLYPIQPTPTVPQVLSVLASNPALRRVSVLGYGFAKDDGENPAPRVLLQRSKELELDGDTRGVFELLDRLDHPRHMDILCVTLTDSEVEDVSQTVGPYVRDYLRRRGSSRSGLGLSLSSGHDLDFQIGDVYGVDLSVPAPARMNIFMVVAIEFLQILYKPEQVTLDLIAYIPPEEIVYYETRTKFVDMEAISAQLPNLRGLHFERMPLPTAFPKANPEKDTEVFRSLQYIYLGAGVVRNDGWGSLIKFLLWRAGSGRRLHLLVISGLHYTVPSIVQEMVREVRLIPMSISYCFSL